MHVNERTAKRHDCHTSKNYRERNIRKERESERKEDIAWHEKKTDGRRKKSKSERRNKNERG